MGILSNMKLQHFPDNVDYTEWITTHFPYNVDYTQSELPYTSLKM
jgi:hypothetical protein